MRCTLPLWTSFLLRAYIWRIILGRSGIINGMLSYVGLNTIVTSIVLIFIGVRLSGSHRAPVR